MRKVALPCLLAVIALIAIYPIGVKSSTDGYMPTWGPYITGTTETETHINWKTEAETWGVVQYTTGEQFALHDRYEDFVIEPVPRQLHQVRLADLMQAEDYRYRVWILDSEVSVDDFASQAAGEVESWLQSHGVVTPGFHFRTLGDGSFRFVVYGDSQEQIPWFTQLDRHKLVADYIAREDGLSFVMHLGDFTYDADDLSGWDMFFEAGREMLANHTIFPVLGNHENNSPVFLQLFGMPPYYSFQSGEARFFVMDTNSHADFEAQRIWLQSELSAAGRQNFVFYHHPAYSSDTRNYGGWEMSRNYWEDIFVNTGLTGVFSGHVHAYEHYQVRGINYFVVGTGGGALADLVQESPPGSINRLAKTLGYARVSVYKDETTVEYIQVARISDDNRQVLEKYPFNTVFETVSIKPGEKTELIRKPAGEFTVSPVSLDIELDSGGSYRFNVYIISNHDSKIYIGKDSLPFEVKPAMLQIQGSEQPQKFELEIIGSRAISNGKYEGKLTFLRDTGDDVALGVKVRTTVYQTGREGVWMDILRENTLLIVAVVLVISANIGGYVAYRKYRARIAGKMEI